MVHDRFHVLRIVTRCADHGHPLAGHGQQGRQRLLGLALCPTDVEAQVAVIHSRECVTMSIECSWRSAQERLTGATHRLPVAASLYLLCLSLSLSRVAFVVPLLSLMPVQTYKAVHPLSASW